MSGTEDVRGLAATAASPADPRPRWRPLEIEFGDGCVVTVRDDPYSDRIRCDHPPVDVPASLGPALVEAARERELGRVVVLAPARLLASLTEAGYTLEARMPGYYQGEEDCVVLRYSVDPARDHLAQAAQVAAVRGLMGRAGVGSEDRRPRPRTERATAADATEIAALVARTFEHYPTPTGVPEYVAQQIEEGIPFRIVRAKGQVVACASADLERDARTAELTDCATDPSQRGRGLMQAILLDLMDDLRSMGYPTAFTLVRACIPGVNLAFARIGFSWRGVMTRSCRIGDGLEDMNVWSRAL